VRLVLRLADEVDGNVDLVLGRRVNDGRWHRVEVRRATAARTFKSLEVIGIGANR